MDIIRKCALTGVRNLATRICASDVTIQARIAVIAKRPLSYTQESLTEIAGRSESDRIRLCTYENGEKISNIFPESEFKDRVAKLRTHMVKNNLDACVFTSYQNILYYSGHLYYYFGRDYGCVVTHDNVCLISALVDGGNPWRRCYGDNLVYTDWHKGNYFHAVQQLLADQSAKRIGLEFDHVSLDNHRKFAEVLPGSEFVDIGEMVMRTRVVKSSAEQEVTRQGARIADIGGAAVVEALYEGAPEYEVERHASNVMANEIAKAYPDSEIRDVFGWVQSGVTSDGAHNPSTTKKIKSGENITINLFPMIQGYYSVLERTMFLNHASDAHLKYWQHNVDVHNRGLELIRPGVKCSEIALELNEMCRERDILQYRTFGYGHSFGAMCHYYGREAGLELREDVDTILQPGMILSMEPMILIPEGREGAGGYREHDILIVTETGAENITKFPIGPEHNIISK